MALVNTLPSVGGAHPPLPEAEPPELPEPPVAVPPVPAPLTPLTRVVVLEESQAHIKAALTKITLSFIMTELHSKRVGTKEINERLNDY